MLKPFIKTFMILLLLVLLNGCNHEKTHDNITENSIQNMQLTKEEEQIIYLIESDKSKFSLFNFDAKDFNSLDIWVEIYNNGELLDKSNKISYTFISNEKTGIIAIAIEKIPDFYYSFSILTEGNKISSLSEAYTNNKSSYSFGSMNKAVNINDNKEIVLYTVLFANEIGGIPILLDEQDLISSPELLMNYSIAHIIKCKFY